MGSTLDRRAFLKCLGAAAAMAALPSALAGAKIARAPAWAKEVMLFECPPLAPGHYTFTAQAWRRSVSYLGTPIAEYLGFCVGAVNASGGETLFEIPIGEGEVFKDPRIKLGAICYSVPAEGGSVDPLAPDDGRGDVVVPTRHSP